MQSFFILASGPPKDVYTNEALERMERQLIEQAERESLASSSEGVRLHQQIISYTNYSNVHQATMETSKAMYNIIWAHATYLKLLNYYMKAHLRKVFVKSIFTKLPNGNVFCKQCEFFLTGFFNVYLDSKRVSILIEACQHYQ